MYRGWGLTSAGMLMVAVRVHFMRLGWLPEAPVNVRRNYNGVKVEKRTALVKSGYMLESLEYLVLLIFLVKKYPVQIISRKDLNLSIRLIIKENEQSQIPINLRILRGHMPDSLN